MRLSGGRFLFVTYQWGKSRRKREEGQAYHADKSLKRPAREARSGRKAHLPRRLIAEATMLPLNIDLLRKKAIEWNRWNDQYRIYRLKTYGNITLIKTIPGRY